MKDVNANMNICLNSLGLLDEVPIDKKGSPIDTLSNYLSKKLAFGKLYVFL